MAFLQWSTDYTVGHHALDHDHRRLAEIINDLHQAVENDAGNAKVNNTLRFLRHYVETHFDREEKILKSCGAPGVLDHIRSHRAIEETLADFESLHSCSPEQMDAEALLRFLRTWLLEHVLDDDMRYQEYFVAVEALSA